MLGEAVASVLQDLVYLLAVALLSIVGYALRSVIAWFTTHTSTETRALLTRLAEAAVPYVERQFPDLPGEQQLDVAVQQVTQWLGRRGVPITAEEIRAQVQRAYRDAKASGVHDVAKPPVRG